MRPISVSAMVALVMIAILVSSSYPLADADPTRSDVPATLKGSVKAYNGERMNGAILRVTDLYDANLSPIADIEIGPDGSYVKEFTVSGKFQAYATASGFEKSNVIEITLVPGKVTWLNVTMYRREALTGFVMTKEGPLPDAAITVRSSGGKENIFTTPATGLYKIFLVSEGTYNVSVSKPGYLTVSRNINVSRGEWVDMNFTLEKVEVTQDPVKIDPMFIYLGLGLGFLFIIALVAAVALFRGKRKKVPLKEDAITDMDCPNCGKAVSSTMTACPHCSELFKIRCPQCGKEYKERVSSCDECEYEFPRRDQGPKEAN